MPLPQARLGPRRTQPSRASKGAWRIRQLPIDERNSRDQVHSGKAQEAIHVRRPRNMCASFLLACRSPHGGGAGVAPPSVPNSSGRAGRRDPHELILTDPVLCDHRWRVEGSQCGGDRRYRR